MSKRSEAIELVNYMDSFDDLKAISDAIRSRWHVLQQPAKAARTEKTQQLAANFRMGQMVTFYHKNMPITGNIVKMNAKTAKVKTGNGVWNVDYSLLEAK